MVKTMVTSCKRSHARAATLSDPNPIVGHCRPTLLLETPTHSWACLSLLWGPCSFPLGPGAHKVPFVPSKSLFPQSCVSSSICTVGLMATSCRTAYDIPRCAAPRIPAPMDRPLLTHTSAGDTQTLKGRSGSVSVGPHGVHKVLFDPWSIAGGHGI